VVGGIGHTTVIGDDLGQLVAECSCGGKVDGIQASQVDLVQRGGRVEQPSSRRTSEIRCSSCLALVVAR